MAVCIPKRALRVPTLLFIQMMLNREQWRYSFYRKCYLDKLRRFKILLPVSVGEIDEDTIQAAVKQTPYWGFLKTWLSPELV